MPTAERACAQGLAFIQQLYAVERERERECAQLDQAARATLRKEKSLPGLASFKNWLNENKLTALPKSPFGKAITYALNNWSSLCTYVQDGELSIDNNKSERALRAMAVGRKNWLFMGGKSGGRAATVLASLIATCKLHNLHPASTVLKRLANGATDLGQLLPDRWARLRA